MEKEIAADLSKIQPPPDQTDLAYEELLKNSEDLGSFTEPITTQKEVTGAIQGMNAQQLAASSERFGSVDPDLDASQMPGEDISSTRARNQSEGIKGLKAVGGGILTGGLIALEQLGYVADLDTYTNLFKEVEDLSGNQWTRLMRDAQEGVRESETFKIYEDAPDENSLASQIFKWTSVEGAVSSAVGFGLTGLGATSLVAKLGSLGKFKQLGGFVDMTMGMAKGSSKAFTGPLASSMMSNYFMGQLMAADTYEQSMAALEENIGTGEGQISRLEAQKLAANNAQEVVGLNMALTATAYLKFGAIFKRKNNFNGIIKDPSAFNLTKQMIAKGSPTAFTENVYQEMIQMEQINDAQREAGMKTEYSDDYWDRMSNLALSNRALHAGALGVVGGPIQFAIIQRPMMGAQLKAQREGYDKQQPSLAWHQKLKDNNFLIFKEETKIINEAIASGKIADAETMQDLSVVNEITKAIKYGTLDFIKNDIQKIANMDAETAIGKHKYDDNYKETAETTLNTIASAEYYLSKVAGAPNTGELIYNRLARDTVVGKLGDKFKGVGVAKAALEARIKTDLQIEGLTIGDDLYIKRDKGRFEGLSDTQKGKLVNQEKKEAAELDKYQATNYEYSEYRDAISEANKYKKLMEKLDSKFREMSTEEYKKDYAKKTDKAEKGRDENLAVTEATLEEKKDADIIAGFQPFSKVLEDGKKLGENAEDKKKRITEWNAETKDKNLPKNTTFSSVDYDKSLRLYTPGDLVRSHDGRYFKVHAQNKSAKKDATTGRLAYKSHAHMPILFEVDAKGNSLKKDKFVLDTNSFLRLESKQITNGKYYATDSGWSEYVQTDSLLKPNDPEHTIRRMEKATLGEANSINISAQQLRENDYEWFNKFEHQLLNVPFSGAYDVVLKMRNEGDGKKFIDVYKKVEGGTDILLTRLDKEYNINYTAISDALVKGPVTGQVTEHFSTSRNLVQELDEDGNKIYHTLSEARNIPKHHLPGGKLIIAQTTGVGNINAYEDIHTAQAEDGTMYEDGIIRVLDDVNDPEGPSTPLEIPFHSMNKGDSYMLLVAPSGKLVPIALSTDTIETLPSMIDGENFTADIVANIYETIDRVLKPKLVEEAKSDDEMRQQILNNKDIAEKDRAYAFKSKKSSLLYEKGVWDDIESDLENTAYKHIRPSKQYSSVIGHMENGKAILERNAKKVPLVKATYFKVTVDVSKTTGKFVPAVEIRQRNDHTKTKKYNIEDHGKIFFEELGARRKKTSIHTLKESSKSEMKDLIENSGMKFDISPTTPFMGSSATIQIAGEDVKLAGADLAARKGAYLSNKYGKFIKEDLRQVLEDKTELALEEFSNKIDGILAHEEGEYSLESMDVEDVGDIKEELIALINSLNIKDSPKVISEALKFLDSEVTEDNEVIFNDTVVKLEAADVTNNVEVIAKVALALRDIQTKVNNDEYTLLYKINRGTPSVPTGRFLQPEGFTQLFQRGTNVYHEVYKESVVQSVAKDGMVIIKPNKRKGTFKVFPAETFYPNGNFMKLSKAKNNLAKAEPGSNTYKSIENSIKRFEASILHVQKKLSPEYESPTGTLSTSDSTLYEQFTALRASSAKLEAVETMGASERADKFSNSLEEVVSLYQDEFFGEKLSGVQVEESVVAKTTAVLQEAIIYNVNELDALIKATNEKIKEGGSTNELRQHKMNFMLLKDVISALDGRTNVREEFKVIGEGINSKGNLKTVTVKLPSSTYKITAKVKGVDKLISKPSEYTDVYSNTRSVVNAYMAAIGSEVAIKSELFLTSKSSAEPVVNTEVKKEAPVKDAAEVVTTPKRVKVTKVKQKVKPKPIKVTDSTADSISNLLDVYGVHRDLLNAIIEKNISEQEIQTFEAALRAVANMHGVDPSKVITAFAAKHNLGKFKIGAPAKINQTQFEAEVAEVKKLLPQVKVEVLEHATQMVNKFGVKALGAYDKGVRFLMSNAPVGTAYHETFHAVADLYLTPIEKQEILEESGESTWDAAEEKAAIEFEAYAKRKVNPTLGQKVKSFFDGIINWFKGTRSTDVTTLIFEKIVTGGFANSKSLNWAETSTLGVNSMEKFKTSISTENSVLLQELMNEGRIKIEC